jgi:uncharacterized protein
VPYFLIGMIAGLLATPHCAGMCGPFPLHLARSAREGRPLARQVLYIAGKTFTCAFLGALAGWLGQWLLQVLFAGSHRFILGYLLGGAMLVMGLIMLGFMPVPRVAAAPTDKQNLLLRVCAHFLHAPGLLSSFILGMATGFLPCGVTMAGLAVAVSSHSVLGGMLAMVGLSLGTAPVLLVIGISATLVNARVRLIGLRTAGLLMILVGVMTMLRPTGLLRNVMPSAASAKAYIETTAPGLTKR